MKFTDKYMLRDFVHMYNIMNSRASWVDNQIFTYTFAKELSQKQESKYESGNEKVLNIIMFHLLCVSDDTDISLCTRAVRFTHNSFRFENVIETSVFKRTNLNKNAFTIYMKSKYHLNYISKYIT